jgi:hypothetical protein
MSDANSSEREAFEKALDEFERRVMHTKAGGSVIESEQSRRRVMALYDAARQTPQRVSEEIRKRDAMLAIAKLEIAARARGDAELPTEDLILARRTLREMIVAAPTPTGYVQEWRTFDQEKPKAGDQIFIWKEGAGVALSTTVRLDEAPHERALSGATHWQPLVYPAPPISAAKDDFPEEQSFFDRFLRDEVSK